MNLLPIKRQTCIIIILLLATQAGYTQKTETYVNVYSGIFSFRGEGAVSNSTIHSDPYVEVKKFTTDPFGKRSGFSYSGEIKIQRVTKKNLVYGISAGYENFVSKVKIDTLTENGFVYNKFAAHGKTTLANSFATIHPFAGYRSALGKLTLDILVGADLAFCFNSKEKGSAKAIGYNSSIAYDKKNKRPDMDIRPRADIQIQYRKLGFLAGYSLGLTNYQAAGDPEIYSSFVRLGVSYRIVDN